MPDDRNDEPIRPRFETRNQAINQARRDVIRLAVIWIALTVGSLALIAFSQPFWAFVVLAIELALVPGLAISNYWQFRLMWRGEFTPHMQNLSSIPGAISMLMAGVIVFMANVYGPVAAPIAAG